MDVLGQLEQQLGLNRIDLYNITGSGTKKSPFPNNSNVTTSAVKSPKEVTDKGYTDIKNVDFVSVSNRMGVPIGNLKQLYKSIRSALESSALTSEQRDYCYEILNGISNNNISREECNRLIQDLNSVRF